MEILEKTLAGIAPLDGEAMRQAEERIRNLTMPEWALGRLCDLGVRLSGIAGRMPPPLGRRVVAVMAGDHGVVEEGVSLHRSEITLQMVANIVAGGAGVNVLGRLNGARVVVADFGMVSRDEAMVAAGGLVDCNVGKGTANMAKGPAMTREEAVRAVENGIELAHRLAADADILATGEMGIGNTTPATAMAAVFADLPVESLCGPGTGLDAAGMRHKVKVIRTSIAINNPDPEDGLDVLAKIGGFEIGGIAGLILGAAACRRPVLVDGFISTAGAMLARALCPGAMPYAILAHASAEPGHTAMCEWLGQRPLLDLNMRLGEGTGAAMAMNILDGAGRLLTEMATFDSAGVDAKVH